MNKPNGKWDIVRFDPRNRRITGTTPMAFSGPVSAAHPMLRSGVTPKSLGTLNNCAHGVTPWNTYLACEENWNGYFGTDDTTWVRNALEARYGVTAAGFGYNWHRAEARLLAGDPAYDPLVPANQPVFGSPDGIWVDPSGIIWIQTDISNSSQNLQSRGYDNIKNNAMLAARPETGEVKRFLTGPRGCEITGVTMSPDQRTMFINVQHPGESTTYWNNLFGAPSTQNPSTVSSWPYGNQANPRRSRWPAAR